MYVQQYVGIRKYSVFPFHTLLRHSTVCCAPLFAGQAASWQTVRRRVAFLSALFLFHSARMTIIKPEEENQSTVSSPLPRAWSRAEW